MAAQRLTNGQMAAQRLTSGQMAAQRLTSGQMAGSGAGGMIEFRRTVSAGFLFKFWMLVMAKVRSSTRPQGPRVPLVSDGKGVGRALLAR